jgi:alanine racemase
MNSLPPLSTWLEIDLSAIEANVQATLNRTRAAVMAVVKAQGYGHGALAVSQAALRAGASWLGVARIEEGLALRHAMVEAPILILGATPPERLIEAVQAGLAITVWSATQIQAAAVVARDENPARLHLKIDSGMNRLGAQPSQALELARLAEKDARVRLEGVFTHFACADDPLPESTDQQFQAFQQAVAELEAAGLRPPWVHSANSAAALTRPETHLDMLRLGIALYGLEASDAWRLPDDFRPALAWKAQLAQVKRLPPGSGVSYGHEYVTQDNEHIGTLPVGYADGLRRGAPNEALIRGVRVPIVGRVCMDQCLLQLDAVPDAQAGDEVLLIGKQGSDRITTQQVAERWGTIPHEVVCGLAARLPRLYSRPEPVDL